MNRLLTILHSQSDLSPAKLKQVYRDMCKRTHPDMASGSHEDFIQLRQEYEEALSELQGTDISAGQKKSAGPETSPSDAREAALEKLYLFSIRLFGSDGEETLMGLIKALGSYRKDVQALWTDYYKLFYKDRKKWMDDGDVFYSHNLFVASVKQLFYYYSYATERYRMLLQTFLEDLEKRAPKIGAEQMRVLRGIGKWLLEEADLEKVALF